MNKDQTTSALRERLLAEVPQGVETDRASSGLTVLSFQSRSHPERHVWIDTDLDGKMVVDLEDWTVEGAWDNSISHLVAVTSDALVKTVAAWLAGSPVEDVLKQGCQPIKMT